jgi:hypothetical protein
MVTCTYGYCSREFRRSKERSWLNGKTLRSQESAGSPGWTNLTIAVALPSARQSVQIGFRSERSSNRWINTPVSHILADTIGILFS